MLLEVVCALTTGILLLQWSVCENLKTAHQGYSAKHANWPLSVCNPSRWLFELVDGQVTPLQRLNSC